MIDDVVAGVFTIVVLAAVQILW